MKRHDEIIDQILQGSVIPTFVIDTNHIITHWNRACEKQTGLFSNEMIGTRKQGLAYYGNERQVLADYIVDETSREVIARDFYSGLQDSSLMDGAFEAEGFFSDLGEKGKWLFFTAAPLKDARGKIIGAIETLQDITSRKISEESLIKEQDKLEGLVEERTATLTRLVTRLKREVVKRKETEAALQESEEKFRTISDFTYNWEYWIDQDGTYAYTSPSFEEISGYSVKEFMENPDLLFTLCHPDDRVKLARHIKEESKTDKVYHMDFRIITQDGDVRWIAHSCQPVYDAEGNRRGRRASNRDITKRIQAEDALQKEREQLEVRVQERTAELSSAYLNLQEEVDERHRVHGALQFTRFSIDHSEDLLYWVDSSGKIVDVNQTMCTKLGYSRAELLSMKVMDVSSNITSSTYQEIWENLEQTGTWRLETSHRCKTGVIIPVEIQFNYIEFDGKGYNCAFARDITQRRELERLVAIEDKMSSLGRVAAGIAHEIRNPLSTINVYLSTLKRLLAIENFDTVDLSSLQDAITEMDTASHKIENVVRRVMDFSNPSQQKKQNMDINKCVMDAVKLSEVTLRKTGILLELKLDETLPQCYIDRLPIEQVMLNLITNATEELKENQSERRLEVSTKESCSQNNGDCITIMVSDSGQGVPRKLRDKIFDPFFTTKNYGSGIGLSICHRIISDHHGLLHVEGNGWGGATFVVQIPITKKAVH